MGLNEYDYSATQLLEQIQVPDDMDRGNVSIGMALQHLINTADIGKEFDGDCDGTDALCYHMNLSTVDKAIIALQKIKRRFAELEAVKTVTR